MSDFDKSTFDPKAAAEARKAEMDEMAVKLEQGVKDIFEGENHKAYLDFCAKLPRYSVNNQILIMLQRPDATMCQSFSGWKDMNRFVKKGEKGIRILAPAPYKMDKEQDKKDSFGKPVLDKDGEPVKETVEVTVNAFKPVSTFDISQTEGEPIPQIGVEELVGDVEGYASLIEAIKETVPVPIEFENIESGAKGYFHIEDNRIAIQEGMSEVQTVKTMIHEAAHQALHSKEAMEHSSVLRAVADAAALGGACAGGCGNLVRRGELPCRHDPRRGCDAHRRHDADGRRGQDAGDQSGRRLRRLHPHLRRGRGRLRLRQRQPLRHQRQRRAERRHHVDLRQQRRPRPKRRRRRFRMRRHRRQCHPHLRHDDGLRRLRQL